ncbi:hypothetical protein H4R34_000678 [Dimargaris verticillata]|uniref:tRNA (cytosine(38)-C(5))-methyltransferase n=1 Tax=Dimargaris verticillata TaxID=2761393 RepID=A0A9W8B9Y6_9FUNG|nr:hypothetical protein H4R34_000678 [Dimargaris verticillata]
MRHRIAEFYSGIGGMHYAWLEAGLSGEVVASFDINTFANEVNRFNFADATIHHRSIESQSLKFYQKLNADVYLMSPPCQPYTRIGLQRGSDDIRAKSFLYLLDVIFKLGEHRPRYLLIENVVGFENSDTHARTLECLGTCAYDIEEFIINPNQLGVPNSRSRYYLLPLGQTPAESSSETHTCPAPQTLEQYLGPTLTDQALLTDYRVPTDLLSKRLKVMDVVHFDSTGSCCFTKGYSHYAEGTGSILHMGYKPLGDQSPALNVTYDYRYFTEYEIAQLMGFPLTKFRFPDTITRKQRYRLLGNSLNVTVVAHLLRHLIGDS